MTGGRTTICFSLILSAGLLLAAGPGCGAASNGKDKPGSRNGKDPELPPVPVTVETVGRAAVKRTLVLSGSVQPQSQVRLFTKIAGRIEELGADTCDEVSEKDVAGSRVLVSLDHKLLDAQLKQAEAAEKLAAVALADAKRDVERAEDLFKTGAVNQQARDKALAARDLAAAQLAQAQAAVAAARVTLDEIRILATIPGTVTHRFLDKGDFVNPGQPLFTIQDLRTVKVLASVPQADLPMLVPGQSRARVSVEGVEGVFDALVTKVEPALDQATLSAPIELRVQNRRRAAPAGVSADGKACVPPWVLASGMSARIELAIEERKDAPVLPLDAVRNDGKKDFVFVMAGAPEVADGKFKGTCAIELPGSEKPYTAEGLMAAVIADGTGEPTVIARWDRSQNVACSVRKGAEFLEARVLSVSKPMPLADRSKANASVRYGQLVTVEVTIPASQSGRFTKEFCPPLIVGINDSSSKILKLAREGLGPEGVGAGPFAGAGALAKRVDVRLGKLGASRGELGWLVELIEPRDLVGREVVTEGVTRLTDGSKIQVVGNQVETAKPAPAEKAEAAAAPSAPAKPGAAPAEKNR
jgi:RND family efflux transporter MFP subunit